ncbi:neutral/alkaline non-lysosomal ceramidase N-terminal domain-containing protein [Synoicihabitans lomoniglobus]|uniref:Neutral/alkaline non-lysosomal ceramidase N-terminal domain-containing protein n=1 Tax=Synoicihabitans lomoniglobus TaxID=2909285 RepID=A0AAF0CPI2_9BACT|nr:neutral/alkaline non-lysosomal ceramidase N-terminal domain-containing protein [Opitutaceae bacterium LMO-M01]WED64879.1 neutral/alkaline non-lysosomal ceramidase N-terminal domain-containing protein [Opitutaceae bacterium LMO-M01]
MKCPAFALPLVACLLAALPLAAQPPSLQVGVGFADITPTAGVHRMRAMGGNVGVVEKIHDPLFANVVVFEQGEQRVALVSLDLIGISNEVWDTIRADIERTTGITQVLCAVTHTHGSGFPTDEVNAYIVERTRTAVANAVANLAPARIGHGRGEINEGYNRRILQPDGTVEMMWNNKDHVPTTPVDDELGVLSIRRVSDNATIATLVNYAVHPVISMNFGELIVSADWPGAMARKVEAAVGGRCIFILGAAGDINPYEADMFRYATPEETFATIEQVASRVAAEVVTTVEAIDDFRTGTPLSFERTTVPMALRAEGLHAPRNHDVELSSFLIDNRFAIVTIPGEIFVELGLDLKHRSPADATWIMANAYDSSGYIPTMQAACEGGYGAAWGTRLEFGAGERLIHQALVNLQYQMDRVVPLRTGP